MKDRIEFPRFLTADCPRLLLFGGKGGVGKTTASTATALAMARQQPDRSILLVSTDPAHSLQDSFAGARLPPNLKVVELDAQTYLLAFKEKNRQRLMEIASRGTFLDEEDINQFLELTLPGMDELMSFLEISHWVTDGIYDVIILDTAPTGHTLRLLKMPELMRTWLGALDTLLAKYRFMKRQFKGSYQQDDIDQFIVGLTNDIVRMKQLFEDPKRCLFIPVMLAEALSVEETRDLLRELKRLGIGSEEVVVNRLYPESQCALCRDIRARQMRELDLLFRDDAFTGLRLWGVPMYPQETKGLEGLLAFWEGLAPVREDRTDNPHSLPFIFPQVDDPSPSPPPGAALLVFAGKGGVGKTTLACATALHLAQADENKRILLFSADPAHSLSDCLNLSVGTEPTAVVTGLWAMEVDAGAEFALLKDQYQHEVKQLLAKLMPNLDLSYDREVMERLMDLSPPGIDEIMALTAVMDLLAQNRFDLVVLDAAPTGHLIRLLELPEISDAWLKSMFKLFLKYRNIFRLPGVSNRLVKVSKDLKRLRAILGDPTKAALYAVSILTEMSFAETEDLLAACKRLAIPVPSLFLNLATPQSEDPLCSSVFRRESLVKKRFAASFPGLSQTVVYRQSDARGLANLTALGQLLFVTGGAGGQRKRKSADPKERPKRKTLARQRRPHAN